MQQNFHPHIFHTGSIFIVAEGIPQGTKMKTFRLVSTLLLSISPWGLFPKLFICFVNIAALSGIYIDVVTCASYTQLWLLQELFLKNTR